MSETQIDPSALAFVNLDEVETETQPAQDPSESSSDPMESIPVTRETVLSMVETFESKFGSDPLKDKLLAFGTHAKLVVDPTDKVRDYLALASEAYNLQIDYKNLLGDNFDRAATVAKLQSVLEVCNVPETKVRA
jgi:hypothetical protein